MKLVNIGFGNAVNADRVIAIVSTDSAPIKRIISEAKEKRMRQMHSFFFFKNFIILIK